MSIPIILLTKEEELELVDSLRIDELDCKSDGDLEESMEILESLSARS